MFKSIRVCCFRLALAALLLAPWPGYAQTADESFLAAHDAYNARDVTKLDALATGLAGHPLQMYVAYWQIALRIGQADAIEVRTFLTRYADTPLADRLRADWLKELGRQGDWQLFNAEHPLLVQEDTEIACYAVQARLANNDPDAYKAARGLWLSAGPSPDACWTLFERLRDDGKLTAQDLWQRIRLALDAGNSALAKQINVYLPATSSMSLKAIDAAAADPQRYIDRDKKRLGSRAAREAMLFALIRLSRIQSSLAAEYLKEIDNRLPAADVAYAWGQIAYRGALGHEPEALAWYAKAGGATLSDAQKAWRVRAALRAGNWRAVQAAIAQLSDSEQRDPAWRYWKARALAARGKQDEAVDILLPLSRETSFYGVLAAEELGPTLSSPGVLWKPSEQEVRAVAQLPGIQRAVYLNRLQLPLEALREWLLATRGFDDRKILTAAEVASRAGWPDRAINTAERTRELHDYSLRFPTPFRDSLTENAQRYGLDAAWVYGLIRQESRFLTEARSSVGAIGLMQLMPATARWVANKLGIKNLRNTQVTDVMTNLALGTFYLRNVLDGLGHPVMATAGYNAGPGRARRWRAEGPLEGAIYAETIPFNETRDYVKKVMTNATLYAWQLGLAPQSLKQRMGTIPGRMQIAESENVDLGPGS